ncbi:PQQ-dependent sugar dehydrogenase [Bacillus sp. FJAT-50079]|nr:PQQ-dependent sugar dehydrogenase [Bacillus sp. FJAT-50079]
MNLFKLFILLLVFIFITACTARKKEESVFDSRVNKLNVPWSITKKDDFFYISERTGEIVSIHEPTGEMDHLPVKLKESLHIEGESGLLGLELIPNTNVEAIGYHTYEENGEVLNRVVRIAKEENQWVEKSALIDGIPGSAIHNGGRIKIGPDDKLYVTTGDAANPESAQNLQSLAGKILRMNLDGTVPSDNPFHDSPIYSYGHRNPQGLAWDESGQLYATEHGQSAHDEINLIKAGKNYGWPHIQGDEKMEGMESPIFHTNGNTWAPSGVAFYQGKLYIATLRGEAVRIFDLLSGKASVFTEGDGRIRDIFIEDGHLFYMTNNTDGRGTPEPNDDQLLKMELNE